MSEQREARARGEEVHSSRGFGLKPGYRRIAEELPPVHLHRGGALIVREAHARYALDALEGVSGLTRCSLSEEVVSNVSQQIGFVFCPGGSGLGCHSLSEEQVSQ